MQRTTFTRMKFIFNENYLANHIHTHTTTQPLIVEILRALCLDESLLPFGNCSRVTIAAIEAAGTCDKSHRDGLREQQQQQQRKFVDYLTLFMDISILCLDFSPKFNTQPTSPLEPNALEISLVCVPSNTGILFSQRIN